MLAASAGVYTTSIPILLATLVPFLFSGELEFKNLEYRIFLPLASEKPAFNMEIKAITDITLTNIDGGRIMKLNKLDILCVCVNECCGLFL